ncbi:MAG: NAD(P)(+) transhydrogenase (Re/Si-specific) subunit beta [Parachlamydiales bacterium]|nr:NAD(P)(+) transhydrogenase (Re/Si-specific) subunit beta [Parachlamydiales bacterium]
MNFDLIINFSYLIAAILFVFGLKLLSSAKTASKGNFISAIGMLIAVLATLIMKEIVDYVWILVGLIVGSLIGIFAAKKVKMTGMPEMVALLNGFGGLASLLVGWAVYYNNMQIESFTASTIFLSILIGGVTFTGSIVAWAKLSEKIPGRPTLFTGQMILNSLILISIIILGVLFSMYPTNTYNLLIAIIIGANILGILVVIPIGGADMPVVISLLNSYSGLAACSAGFVIQNNVLIVSGALVGASGIILTSIMCKAMNRSIGNVLFSGFGSITTKPSDKEQGEVKSCSAKDAYYVLEAAKSIAIVPGYGLAVASAQHVVKELADLLEENGSDVKFAIHPVAGRMPGHMNVLLAEADVSYDKLVEMDDINRIMDSVDVCLVIGANDVVNPSAKEDPGSPIYGMPIIEVDRAKNVFVLKRSMASGFAGIANPLFFKENTTMIFGDAKKTITQIVDEF